MRWSLGFYVTVNSLQEAFLVVLQMSSTFQTQSVFPLYGGGGGKEGGRLPDLGRECKRVSMGLTVNRQMAKKLTVNRQKRNIFAVTVK